MNMLNDITSGENNPFKVKTIGIAQYKVIHIKYTSLVQRKILLKVPHDIVSAIIIIIIIISSVIHSLVLFPQEQKLP
jgi:hypothetical protein